MTVCSNTPNDNAMDEVNFLEAYQKKTTRNYIERVTAHDKGECAERAKKWGFDYWDGERHLGYGGYKYDGRWLPIAKDIATHYGLKAGDKILDIGCGKAFLLYEFTNAVEGVEIAGLDISEYGIEHAKEEAKPCVNPPLAEINVPTTIYKVNAEKGATLEFKTGSKITIPKNSFVDRDGKLIKGEVELHYREFHDPVDFFVAGIAAPPGCTQKRFEFDFQTE